MERRKFTREFKLEAVRLSQEFCDDGKRGPAIDTGARYTRIIGYAKSVAMRVDDLVTSASGPWLH
jgi:hypothetical protein